ncbi:hypothetical protein EGW08_020712 [Elysia chlorotica]|uniref:Syndecan n=1 Tax=Elysia chlorotica TaxID=188477 RepID=A0A3S1BP65_ELYCH|nr:hypothetical protein EGW08_020712 [Elysia chlorotica]
MDKGIMKIFLVSLCLYGFTNAQGELGSERHDFPPVREASFPLSSEKSADIEFDQDPPFAFSGDGKFITSDDEDYGVSGSGSGSGLGIYDPDVEVEGVDSKSYATTTTTSTTTKAPESPDYERAKTTCETVRMEASVRLTSYVPACNADGDFEALQCQGHAGTSDCFCVDLHGSVIPGTYTEKPNFPDCEEGTNLQNCTHQVVKSSRSKLLGQPRPHCAPDGLFERVQCIGSSCFCVDPFTGKREYGSETRLPDKPDCAEDNGTIDVDENSDWETDNKDDDSLPDDKFDDRDGVPEKFPELDTDERDDQDSSSEDDTGAGGNQGSTHGKKNRVEKASEILTQPGILAGIIGGGVVVLLCLVLLIMFVVYRMRKKDEGSYPLDEPRRGPPNYSYVRAPDKEYYA